MRLSKFIVSTAGLLMLACVLFASCSAKHPMIPFERSKWDYAKQVFDWDSRRGMANYLIRNGQIVGKKRSILLAELGDTNVRDSSGNNDLNYPIMEKYQFLSPDAIYTEYLVIHFNTRDIAIETYISVIREDASKSKKDLSFLHSAPRSCVWAIKSPGCKCQQMKNLEIT